MFLMPFKMTRGFMQPQGSRSYRQAPQRTVRRSFSHRPVLARQYGFTDEELDFILNYDINHRLGRDTEAEEG